MSTRITLDLFIRYTKFVFNLACLKKNMYFIYSP